MLNWLKPSIDEKAVAIFDFFVQNESGFDEVIKKIPPELRNEFENVYLVTIRKAIHKAYTKGIEDAIKIIK